ncbi:MAG: hypothetical protein PHZ14_07550 [Sulfuricella sp.]|nr:hypothetical protein [Sulfuricella sp.]
MKTHLHIFGNSTIWGRVRVALGNLPDLDSSVAEKLGDEIVRDRANNARLIELPNLGHGLAGKLTTQLSSAVPDACLKLSEWDRETNIETIALYHAGQRLGQRTVAWPLQDGESPRVVATETECRFQLQVITETPDRLDAMINNLAVQQESLPGEHPVFPIMLAIPGAENSWGGLPGFRSLSTMTIGPSGRPHDLHGSTACIQVPEPQSMLLVEAIRRPAATVFEMECLVHGLPMSAVREIFNEWLGSWGRAYSLPLSDAVKPIVLDEWGMSSQPSPLPPHCNYFLASLVLLKMDDRTDEENWNLLYGQAGRLDSAMEWPGDVDDPYGWADLPISQFAPNLAGDPFIPDWLAIARRVPVPQFHPDQQLFKKLEAAKADLPANLCIEIAYTGTEPWSQRFCVNGC